MFHLLSRFILGLLILAVYAKNAHAACSAAASLESHPRREVPLQYTTPNSKGEMIAYVVEKPPRWNGQTVVLISGISRGMLFWNFHAEDLYDQGYRVVRLDSHNIGETLRANGVKRTPRIEDDADAVLAVLEELNIQRNVYLVGHSRGAAVAILVGYHLENDGRPAKKILAANPYVQWLPSHFSNGTADKVSAMMSPLDIWAQLPFVGSWVQAGKDMTVATMKGTHEATANMASSMMYSEVAAKFLSSREPHERVGLSIFVEIRGVSEVMDGMKNTTILPVAEKLETPVTIYSTCNTLEPQPLISKLHNTLRNPTPVQYLAQTGDHCAPTAHYTEFKKVLNQFLEN